MSYRFLIHVTNINFAGIKQSRYIEISNFHKRKMLDNINLSAIKPKLNNANINDISKIWCNVR